MPAGHSLYGVYRHQRHRGWTRFRLRAIVLFVELGAIMTLALTRLDGWVATAS